MKKLIVLITFFLASQLAAEVVTTSTSLVTVISNKGNTLIVKNKYNQKFKIHSSQIIAGSGNAGEQVRIKEKIKLKRYSTPVIKKDRLKKAKKRHVIGLVKAYQKFFVEVQNNYSYPAPQLDMKSFSYRVLEFFDNKAKASGETCFFGGWRSEKVGNYCTAPWKIDNAQYDSSTACGRNNLFRCNPLLFGKPSEEQKSQETIHDIAHESTPPKNGSDAGFCVRIENYSRVTEKCAEVSKDNLDSIAEVILDNEAKMEEFSALQSEVNSFCEGNSTYTACSHLMSRVSAIDQKITLETSPKIICEVLRNNALETQEGASEQCPRAVLMKCSDDDGNHFTGYLDQTYSAKADAAAFNQGSQIELNQGGVPVNSSIASGQLTLKDKPCGTAPTAGHGQCLNLVNADSNVLLRTSGSEGCDKDVCRYKGECDVNGIIKEVSLVCACGIEKNENNEISNSSLCASFPLRKRTPSNYNEYSEDQQNSSTIER